MILERFYVLHTGTDSQTRT